MEENKTNSTEFLQIPFSLHPRVFAALGADLVTNDVVAIIELVKNSYDAFAHKVCVRFRYDNSNDLYLEVQDDGIGMTLDTIKDIWGHVATPYKEENPIVKRGKETRRVSGEKGLGRLSIARLGERLEMLTQAAGSPCWEVAVNWETVAKGSNISTCTFGYREYKEKSPFKKSGTRLRVLGLKGHWDEATIQDLADNLTRLISPFSDSPDFDILLLRPDDLEMAEIKIISTEFLSYPKYLIEGEVDRLGNIKGRYKYKPVMRGKSRTKNISYSWEKVFDNIKKPDKFPFSAETAHCGPFTFEIRAWDIGPDDTQEISERFKIKKSIIRSAIRMHKGISLYRDSILVLPKSDNVRDWLGLDLRRVSWVGPRVSTNQIVGYVSISAELNPCINDTSDRERLVTNREVAEFEEILNAIIALLENERAQDRITPDRAKPLQDLFGRLSAKAILSEVMSLAKEDASAAEAVPIIKEFTHGLDRTRDEIQERFVYYSRLATVGTIALMLVHEIRNRTIAFGSLLDFIKSRFGPFKDKDLDREYINAVKAVDALERLADTFSPLAARSFGRRKRYSKLEERIIECLYLLRKDLDSKQIKYDVPESDTQVSVDPGELDAIILNLLTNSIYWLDDVPEDKRKIKFDIKRISGTDRIQVSLHDTGPGIDIDDAEKIFWPGVTNKIGGIGMGLTVASELVSAYNGQMLTEIPGKMGGATFTFDLPLRK